MIKDAPDGWEDESGFHFGKQDKNSQPKADPPLAEKAKVQSKKIGY